ncbi:MAG: threonine synthase [Bacteroidetes bacterium HGW-Bacteroidetes-4]|jgi:threonine synthase|nr:MAG: threonine synthase [Bacteroidetes bacterium HGW-Bacteroidetes-4]
MLADKFHYTCSDCGNILDSGEIRYLCPVCQQKNTPEQPSLGVLKLVYPWNEIRAKFKNKPIWEALKQSGFIDILPINKLESFPYLKVGSTPVYKITENLDEKACELYVKDDSQNPTYSFKDRASALVSAFAKENGITTIAAASTGNAGSSIAGICASQKQQAVVFVPANAPLAKLTQILMYGAKLIPVKGNYDNAFDLSIEASDKYGWYNRNTAFNPLTIEGKKTVSLEIYEQFNGKLPDYIFVPVGDGVIISGVYKGFEDLLQLKLITKIPTLVAVQASGSNNLIINKNRDKLSFSESHTLADSISVTIPRNFFMARNYLNKYQGKTIEVSDEQILQASYLLSKNTGLFAEPAAAASLAGFLNFKKTNKLDQNSGVLLLLTGSGLKDLNATKTIMKVPEPIACNLTEVKKILEM